MATKSDEIYKSLHTNDICVFLYFLQERLVSIWLSELFKEEVIFIAFVLLAYLAGAVWLDLKYGKIHNYYIVFGILLAVLLRGLAFQLTSCISIIFGSLILFILLYPLFKLGTIGAGDIKLLIACVWYFNAKTGFLIAIGAFVVGAILSLIKMVRYHEFTNRMNYLWKYICEVVETKTIKLYESNDSETTAQDYNMQVHKIHFSIAIAISASLIMFYS